jgi:acyl carrier protein
MTDWDGQFETIVRSVLTALPRNEPLPPAVDLPALGLDSLNMIRLIIEVEGHYRVEIPDDRITPETCATPDTLWRLVSGLIADRMKAEDLSRSGDEPVRSTEAGRHTDSRVR